MKARAAALARVLDGGASPSDHTIAAGADPLTVAAEVVTRVRPSPAPPPRFGQPRAPATCPPAAGATASARLRQDNSVGPRALRSRRRPSAQVVMQQFSTAAVGLAKQLALAAALGCGGLYAWQVLQQLLGAAGVGV
eukprot:SAG11_NODE_1403_length_5007_cov_3.825591_3_plen_137_part_00